MSILSFGGVIMEKEFIRYTLRIKKDLLERLGYIAEYEGRTKNRQIEQLIKKCIAEFENEHGKIDESQISEINY